METQKPTFETFLFDVPAEAMPFVMETHTYLTDNGCTVKVETAKSGYVVSYQHKASGRVLANYVFRKKGMLIRIYGDNVGQYEPFLSTVSPDMQKAMAKAPVCRRLLDPTKCNARCPMGNVFTLDGTEHKKCRYSSFMFLVNGENAPYLRAFLEEEIGRRAA